MKKKSLELSVQDLMTLTAYAHWIPITRELYRPYFESNFPGWEWNQIIPVLISAKILLINSEDPRHRALSQGLFTDREITRIRIWVNSENAEIKVSLRKTVIY